LTKRKKNFTILVCLKGGKMRELLNACKDGDLEKVKQLLESRADVNARNKDGKTALRIALEEGHKEIVKLLKSYGAKE